MSAVGLPAASAAWPAGLAATTGARLAAAALVVGTATSLALLRPIRIGEAVLSTALLTVMGTGAERVGSSVLVEVDGGRAGFTIAAGCSTALLAIPFAGVGALALLTGRVRTRHTLTCIAAAVVGVVVVNQLRFGLVGGAIHLFGYERGYGQSHVLIGTLVSTTALTAGLAAFVWGLGRDPRGAGQGGAPCSSA